VGHVWKSALHNASPCKIVKMPKRIVPEGKRKLALSVLFTTGMQESDGKSVNPAGNIFPRPPLLTI
jgi:hypothetical protein